MTRRSASTGRNRRPADASIAKTARQQRGEEAGPQRSNPYSGALLAIWERRIAKGDIPTGAELADLLSVTGPGAPPPWLLDHVCRHLRGQVRRRPGPKTGSVLEKLVILVAVQRYGELLAWLQKRKRSQRLNGRSCVRGVKRRQDPSHELARRIVQRRFVRFRRIGIAQLANIMSSRK